MKKQYTLTLKGKVQQVGFRGYAEDLCRELHVGGMIYNIGENEVKILCRAEEAEVNRLCELLKEYRLAEITEAKIERGLQLPHQLRKGITGLEQELFTRLDSGIKILENMNQSVKLLENMNEKIGLLENMNEKIGLLENMNEKIGLLENMNEGIDGIKQNTVDMKVILERIERKL
jgi:acylphosphatase